MLWPVVISSCRYLFPAVAVALCAISAANADGPSANAGKTHWAFTAPVRPALPAVDDAGWCRNSIDRFVLAKLEAAKMAPSPEADRTKLLRRLHLDLIGLPPTPTEVDAFLADHAPDAYEREVERLLASPHYGERWGRLWLDAARYADSDGFEKDKRRSIWPYRDYVINAFNRDLPYDQFIIEQLAGDQLPRATQDQIVATGFLRNSMLNEEAGADPEDFRLEGVFDRMDCIGKSILGLTIQCARCHDHKHDPISQAEYYRLFAFLNNDEETQPVIYSPAERAKIAELTGQMKQIEADLKQSTPNWLEQMAAWEQTALQSQTHWIVLPLESGGDNSEHYLPLRDGSYLSQGYVPTKLNATFRWTHSSSLPITAFRLELLTDPSLPGGGPGRSLTGSCALTEFSVEAAPAADPSKVTRVKFASATADFEPPETALDRFFDDQTGRHRVTGPARFSIDDDDTTAWSIDAGAGRRNQARKAVFQCAAPLVAAKAAFPDPAGTIVTFNLKQQHGGWNTDDVTGNNIGRFRISATIDPGPVVADPVPARVREILGIPRARRTQFQIGQIFAYWRTTVPQWADANARIEALWKQWPQGATSLTLAARDEPRRTFLFERGDISKPNELMSPGVPAFLNPLPEDGAAEPGSRLALAQWLVSPRSPTTARAFVNRMWQAYFGTGIVATPEDFGLRGDAPSNAALLDWLACEFMQRHWSIKAMHRLIVSSATYRQDSRVTAEAYARDPNNRLLARGSRFRVDGEIVRDIALSASGLLNSQIGGSSVMPPAPAFLFQPPSSFAPFSWIEETGEQRFRRALYTFRRRSTPYPMLQAFDVPNADSACVGRLRSNTPLQALVSLNEPVFVQCAQALAIKTMSEGGANDAQRIEFAFRRTLSRPPTASEVEQLIELLERTRARLTAGELKSDSIMSSSPRTFDKLPAADCAAYTVVSRVLLNLDETITRE
jgi:hypothetical protein